VFCLKEWNNFRVRNGTRRRAERRRTLALDDVIVKQASRAPLDVRLDILSIRIVSTELRTRNILTFARA